VIGQPYKTLHFHPQHRHQPYWIDPSENRVGPA